MATTTNFPKISGKTADFLEALEHSTYLRSNRKIDAITMTGTVKLHGAHFDVVVNSDNSIRLQSRNLKNLSIEKDVDGFAAFMAPLSSKILALKTRYFDKFKQLNPRVNIDNRPLIIAGEWVGNGVKKENIINSIPKRIFVIFSVQVNGNWLPDRQYADISDEACGIFNISRGGFFTQPFLLKGNTADMLDRMQLLANGVENECPFTKNVFGVSGQGEGIVWKAQSPLCEKPKFWVKMKGPINNGTNAPNVTHGSMREFVIAKVSKERMEQALSYLKEMGYKREKGDVRVFLDWIIKDIKEEEKGGILAWGMDKGANAKFLVDGIEAIAGKWYLGHFPESPQNPITSLPKPRPDENMKDHAKKFATACVDEAKLEDRFKLLKQDLRRDPARGNVAAFIKLVKQGVFEGERGQVGARGLDKGRNKEYLEDAIENLAGNWFFKQNHVNDKGSFRFSFTANSLAGINSILDMSNRFAEQLEYVFTLEDIIDPNQEVSNVEPDVGVEEPTVQLSQPSINLVESQRDLFTSEGNVNAGQEHGNESEAAIEWHTSQPPLPSHISIANAKEISNYDVVENLVETILTAEETQHSVPDIEDRRMTRKSFPNSLTLETASQRTTLDSFKTAFSRATSAANLLQRPNARVYRPDSIVGLSTVTNKAESTLPFDEHDWCGRGMHVDFMDHEYIPLKWERYAGKGATASVDIVRCRGIKLARKIIRLQANRMVTKELLQEVQTLHRVSHSHVVRLVGTYIHKRDFATLLYPAAETNLEEYMRDIQQTSPETAYRSVAGFRKFETDWKIREVLSEGSLCLVSGLRSLHKHGINHSDIKPANVILKEVDVPRGSSGGRSFRMYFCDFGISRIFDLNAESQTEEVRERTPMWAAPEVMKWDLNGPAADIFSLGCVLAEMTAVSSGFRIEDLRNYIHETNTPDYAATQASFKAYHMLEDLNSLTKFFFHCFQLGVPKRVIVSMMDRKPNKRPRLLPSIKRPDNMAFEMECKHNNDGPPPFEID